MPTPSRRLAFSVSDLIASHVLPWLLFNFKRSKLTIDLLVDAGGGWFATTTSFRS